METAPWPSRTVAAALALVLLLALWSDLSRFLDPLGEKYVFLMPPGAADFIAPYQGARALVAGVDPYRNQREQFRDPWHREALVDGTRTSQFYPPTHLLLLTPLVVLYGGDLRAAGRAWFAINCLVLLALGRVTARLATRALAPETAAASSTAAASTSASASASASQREVLTLLTLCLTPALALHGGVLLGLERGQSDLLIALLSWGAILLALDGKFARAAFLATFATLLKGYALVLALGVLAMARREQRSHLRALAGAAVAIGVGLLPVVRWLPAALHNMRARFGTFHPAWYNVSFRSLTELTTPFAARPLALALCALALVAAALAWLAARRARETAPRARWLCAFGATAMAATLGAPAVTYSYALINVLPGVLVLACAHDRLGAQLQLSPRGETLRAATVLVMLALLYKLRLGSEVFPLAPLGLMALAAMVALVGARALRGAR